MVKRQGPATIIRLAQPIEDGARMLDEIYLAGRPGAAPLPLIRNGDEVELDALGMERIVSQRTGLSQSAVRKLAPLDLMTVMFVLFAPAPELAPQRVRAPKSKR